MKTNNKFALVLPTELMGANNQVAHVLLRDLIGFTFTKLLLGDLTQRIPIPMWPGRCSIPVMGYEPVKPFFIGKEANQKELIAQVDPGMPADNVGKWDDLLTWLDPQPFFYPLKGQVIKDLVAKELKKIKDSYVALDVGRSCAVTAASVIKEQILKNTLYQDLVDPELDITELIIQKFKFVGSLWRADESSEFGAEKLEIFRWQVIGAFLALPEVGQKEVMQRLEMKRFDPMFFYNE